MSSHARILERLAFARHYGCLQCGLSCSSFLVPLSEKDRAGFDRLVASNSAENLRGVRTKQAIPYNEAGKGVCLFCRNSLCLIHAEHGVQAKPEACQAYPFTHFLYAEVLYEHVALSCSFFQDDELLASWRHEKIEHFSTSGVFVRVLEGYPRISPNCEISGTQFVDLRTAWLGVLADRSKSLEISIAEIYVSLRRFLTSKSLVHADLSANEIFDIKVQALRTVLAKRLELGNAYIGLKQQSSLVTYLTDLVHTLGIDDGTAPETQREQAAAYLATCRKRESKDQRIRHDNQQRLFLANKFADPSLFWGAGALPNFFAILMHLNLLAFLQHCHEDCAHHLEMSALQLVETYFFASAKLQEQLLVMSLNAQADLLATSLWSAG